MNLSQYMWASYCSTVVIINKNEEKVNNLSRTISLALLPNFIVLNE
jgi:hypothetical protein